MINAGEMLINAALAYGNRVALSDNNGEIDYNGLLSKAYELSVEIRNKIATKNNPVLVVSSKNRESVVAIWGVILSGNYYICVDSKTAIDRFLTIYEQVNPQLIVYTSETNCGKYDVEADDICVDFATEAVNDVLPTPDIDAIKQHISKNHVIDEDPLYMVLTSGSTGTPKVIIKSHRSLIAFVESFVDEFELGEASDSKQRILGNQAAFDFDVSAKDIYISVYTGSKLCLIPNNCFLVPKKISEYLDNNGISTLIWAASAVKYIYKFDCFKNIVPASLKEVFFSGESMTGDCVEYWKSHIPSIKMVNLYAPSEVTGNCLYHIATDDKYPSILPLDTCFGNIDVLVLDEDGDAVKDGQKGEIYIRGAFLARGYCDRWEETEKRFIQNPTNKLYPDIVYKTGDFVTKNGDRLYFAGRSDNQIKHMGHRIELEEIEFNCLEAGITANLCVLYDSENEKIVMLTEDKTISYDELVARLKGAIPKYMIPHELVYVDKIPHNERGKIDRISAKKLYLQNQ